MNNPLIVSHYSSRIVCDNTDGFNMSRIETIEVRKLLGITLSEQTTVTWIFPRPEMISHDGHGDLIVLSRLTL